MSADSESRVSRLEQVQPPFSHPSHTSPLPLLSAGNPGDPDDPGDGDDDNAPAVKVEGCQTARRRN